MKNQWDYVARAPIETALSAVLLQVLLPLQLLPPVALVIPASGARMGSGAARVGAPAAGRPKERRVLRNTWLN
jgi:hypothetical protein